jgi:hypothetical protein
MDKLNKEEFLKRLQEDTWFDNPKELITYRLPVIQYFLDHIVKANMIINGIPLDPKGIQIIERDEDFTLVNQAFLSLKERVKQFN